VEYDPDATRASGTLLQPDSQRPDRELAPAPAPPPPAEPAFVPAPPVSPDRYRRPGVWKIALPALVALAAGGAAAPVAAPVVLALVALPAVATAGDTVVYLRLRREGVRLRWVHRATLPAYLPWRFVRNIGMVAVRGVPALVLGAVAVALTLVLDAANVSRYKQELLLRPAGVAVVVLLTLPVVRDRVRFRAAVVADAASRRLLEPDGRLTHTGLALWVVATLVALVGFGLHPDPWPL
jgi:hypothetical protein